MIVRRVYNKEDIGTTEECPCCHNTMRCVDHRRIIQKKSKIGRLFNCYTCFSRLLEVAKGIYIRNWIHSLLFHYVGDNIKILEVAFPEIKGMTKQKKFNYFLLENKEVEMVEK